MEGAGRHPRCVICNQAIEEGGVNLNSKGVDGVNRASKARGDSLNVIPGDSVHNECRQRYTHPTYIAKSLRQEEQQTHPQKTLRSRGISPFEFRKDCLFCGTEVDKAFKKRKEGEGEKYTWCALWKCRRPY